MFNIVLLVAAVVSFLFQVGFSIYYSINIVDISTQVNQIQKNIDSGQIDLQNIKTQYFNLNSISFIKEQPSTKTLHPITKSIETN